MREGKWDAANMRYTKSYWSPTQNKYIELRVVMSDVNTGSVQTAIPNV